jgi:hypothetical protein
MAKKSPVKPIVSVYFELSMV